MKSLDLSDNPRIPVLMELVNSMHRFTDPRDLLNAFVAAMRRAYGSRGYLQLSTRGLPAGNYRISRLLSKDNIDHVDHAAAGTNPLILPIHTGGILAQAVASGKPTILHDLDLHNDPVVGDMLAPYRALMATPLTENGIGVDWVVVLETDPLAFSSRELEDMILRGNLVAAMLKNLDTTKRLTAATVRIAHEIEAIGRIQRSLLPDHMPNIPGVQIAASYNTFDRAGGDLYDFRSLALPAVGYSSEDDPRWALLIGDVSGHGPAAAVVMAMFHSILHAYPRKPRGPGEVLDHINRHLCDKSIEQSFVTAFLGFYDPATRELTYARAGHNPPLVKDFPHRGLPTYLDAVGELPLGIFPDVRYSETTIQLKSSQTLILYTDGITEARTGNGEMFGPEGIEHSLIECSGAAECAISHIMGALKAHQLDVRPDDDQTVVVMNIL